MKNDRFGSEGIAPPRVGQLPRKCVARFELVARLSAVDWYLAGYRVSCEDLDSRPSDLISDKFLKCLVDVLDAPCSEAVSFADRLRSAVSAYARDAARIRFELSRVPFLFRYRREVYESVSPLSRGVSHCFWRAGRKYVYGSDSFPTHVLVESVDELSDGQCVWGFYPVDLADKVIEKRMRVWAEETSFVNWVFSPDLIASRHDVDGAIDLAFEPCDTSSVEGVVASDGSAKERLYAYICARSGVRSRDLVAQGIVSRSQTYRLLHQLDIEDRIEREEGVCIVKDV